MTSKAKPAKRKTELLSLRALALKLGNDRNTIKKYLKLEGAPKAIRGKYDLEAVREWLRQKSHIAIEGTTYAELKRQRAEVDLKKAKIDLAEREGQLIRKGELFDSLAPIMAAFNHTIWQKMVFEVPSQYRGKVVAECQAINEAALNEAMKELNAYLDSVKTKPDDNTAPNS